MFTQARPNASHARFSTPSITTVLPFVAGLLLAGLALGPAQTAHAQAAEPAGAKADTAATEAAPDASANALGITASAWRSHFGEQAAWTLLEGSLESKKEMLRNLILVANLDQNGIDLSAAVPWLVRVLVRSDKEEHRLMALHALGAIGTDHATEFAYRRAIEQISQLLRDEPPGHVRHVATHILDRFYEEHREPIR